jgi:hypothetical protein
VSTLSAQAPDLRQRSLLKQRRHQSPIQLVGRHRRRLVYDRFKRNREEHDTCSPSANTSASKASSRPDRTEVGSDLFPLSPARRQRLRLMILHATLMQRPRLRTKSTYRTERGALAESGNLGHLGNWRGDWIMWLFHAASTRKPYAGYSDRPRRRSQRRQVSTVRCLALRSL